MGPPQAASTRTGQRRDFSMDTPSQRLATVAVGAAWQHLYTVCAITGWPCPEKHSRKRPDKPLSLPLAVHCPQPADEAIRRQQSRIDNKKTAMRSTAWPWGNTNGELVSWRQTLGPELSTPRNTTPSPPIPEAPSLQSCRVRNVKKDAPATTSPKRYVKANPPAS